MVVIHTRVDGSNKEDLLYVSGIHYIYYWQQKELHIGITPVMSAISQPIGMDAQIPSTPIAGIGQILFHSKKIPHLYFYTLFSVHFPLYNPSAT